MIGSNKALLQAAAGVVVPDPTFVEDYFSIDAYAGNAGSQSLATSVDLSGGGMIWTKARNSSSLSHAVTDSNNNYYNLENTNVGGTNSYTTFTSSGYTMNNSYGNWNASGNDYISYTFAKQEKFFDMVDYTGNGTETRNISHSLGCKPAIAFLKRKTETGGPFVVKAIGTETGNFYPSSYYQSSLNGTNRFSSNLGWRQVAMNESYLVIDHRPQFSIISNTSGEEYTIYFFAHDPSETGLSVGGSYIGNGSTTGPEVDLGWEPQFVLIKAASIYSQDWHVFDNHRGLSRQNANDLVINNKPAEADSTFVELTSTGFKVTSSSDEVNQNTQTYVYWAIRRGPMREPTAGSDVVEAVRRSGTGADATRTASNFADVIMTANLPSTSASGTRWFDRLRGNYISINSYTANAETDLSSTPYDLALIGQPNSKDYLLKSNGNVNASGVNNYVDWIWTRRKKVFDVVHYVGNGANRTIPHSLDAVPEFIITKAQNNTFGNAYGMFIEYVGPLAPSATTTGYGRLDTADGQAAWSSYDMFGNKPTKTEFSLSSYVGQNNTGFNYSAFLWSNLAGVCDIGTYTGNGSDQYIDCGFSSGVRWLFITGKSATYNRSWVFDTTRGITTGVSPAWAWGDNIAEHTTDDAVDPSNAGFRVIKKTTVNVNELNEVYYYVAIAA